MTAIPFTDAGLKSVKRALQLRFPDDKSSHLTEALAAACGYKSQAALLAEMKAADPADPDFVLLEEAPFLTRLAAVTGRPISAGDRHLAFDNLRFSDGADVIRTSSPRQNAIDYAGSIRLRAWRNAMVAAINAGLDQRLFSVRAGDNRWPGSAAEPHERGRPHVYRFEFEGVPAIAAVDDAGYDELSIHVAFWPAPEGERWVRAANAGFEAGDLFASGWLERRDGAWLQVSSGGGRGWSFRCRQNRLATAAAWSVRPKGFADRGNFKM